MVAGVEEKADPVRSCDDASRGCGRMESGRDGNVCNNVTVGVESVGRIRQRTTFSRTNQDQRPILVDV